MKDTLTANRAAHILLQDDNAAWSYAGANALCEYLERMEEDCETEIEFDVVAIRCDFSEFASLEDWAKDYFSDWIKDLDIEVTETLKDGSRVYCCWTTDDKIRDYITDRAQLIEFDGGVIVSSF
tara:strand:+ start:10225 stop:10596 length:372 start_codon:yes stop_codon:yes gene_type:complete